MLNNLRRKFVIITMSMLAGMIMILFIISNRYDRYWDEYDTHRIVQMVANNGYLNNGSGEALALVRIDAESHITIDVNDTDLTNKEVKTISQSLLKKGKKGWKWRDIIYSLKEKKDGSWQLVFIDLESYSVSYGQVFLTIVFTVFGFLLLTGVSIYLSRFITQPAQAAINREKQFVSDASHELKTPIASIRANAQVLQNKIKPNRYLEHILSETKRMENLVQDLLGLSKLDEKQGDINFSDVNLSEICEELPLNYESLAYEEGKLIESDIVEDIRVLGQDSQLKQLITILLDNAIKYSLDQSTIRISLTQEKKKAVLQVSNPSPSYSQEVMDSLFERFYQVEGSHHSFSSFGLGLAIAKAIVTKHKGEITAIQDHGNMIFTVHLPIK